MPLFGGGSKNKQECRVVMLDNSETRHQITSKTYGHELLWKILTSLSLHEKEYFGLRYKDRSGFSHWIVLHKTIRKQIVNYDPPYTFYFGVKFYAADPTKLQDEVTRYQFFLQVKRDMFQGRVVCDHKTTAELSAYAVQSELGDYDPAVHTDNFLSEFRFIPNQTVELELLIQEKYEKLRGMPPAKAEFKFLERAKWLDMYGVDLHPVRGQDNMEYLLGLTPTGIVLYKKKKQIGSFIWLKVTKLKYKGSCFLLRATQGRNDEEKEYAFICTSKDNAKSLWKLCAEQHTFFRLEKQNNMPASGFNVLFNKKDGSGGANGGQQRSSQPIPTRTPSQRFSRRESEKENNLDNSNSSNQYMDQGQPQMRSYEPSHNARPSPKAASHRTTGYSSAGEAEQKKRRGHYYSGYTNSQSDHEGGRTKSSRYASNSNMEEPVQNRQSRQYSQESLYPNGHVHMHNGYEQRNVRPSGSKSDSEETNRRRRGHHNGHTRHSGAPSGTATDTEMVPALDVYRNTMGVAVNGNEEHRQQRRHHNGQQQRQHRHRHSQYAYDPSQAEVLLELGPPGGEEMGAAKPELARSASQSDKENGQGVQMAGYPPQPQFMQHPQNMAFPIPHQHNGAPTPGMPPPGHPGHAGQFLPQQYYPPHLINQVRHQMMHMHNVSQHLGAFRPQQPFLHDPMNPAHMQMAPKAFPPTSNTSSQPGQSGRSTTSSSKSLKGGGGGVGAAGAGGGAGGEMAANYSVSTEL